MCHLKVVGVHGASQYEDIEGDGCDCYGEDKRLAAVLAPGEPDHRAASSPSVTLLNVAGTPLWLFAMRASPNCWLRDWPR